MFTRIFRKKYDALSDSELLDRFNSNRNQNYLAILFARYSHLIYLVSVKYLKDADKAEDNIMDIYELLVNRKNKLRVVNFKNWIYTVTKNHCLGIIRKEKALNKKISIINIENVENLEFLTQQDETLFEEGLVRKIIDELKTDQKNCIIEFYYNKRSYKEISNILTLSLKNVKSNIQNGKRNLKNLLVKNLGNN